MSSVSNDEYGIAIKRYGMKNEKKRRKKKKKEKKTNKKRTGHVAYGEGEENEEIQYSIR